MPPRLPPGARLLSNVRGGVAWTLWRCRPALGGDAHGHWRPTPCAGRLRRCSRVPTATRARRGSLSPLGDVPSGETDASGVRRPRCAAHSRLTQPALLGGVGGTGRATGGGAHADALSYAVAKAAAVAAAAAAMSSPASIASTSRWALTCTPWRVRGSGRPSGGAFRRPLHRISAAHHHNTKVRVCSILHCSVRTYCTNCVHTVHTGGHAG